MSNDLISRKAVERMMHDYFTSLIEKHINEVDIVDCNAELQKRLDDISAAYAPNKVVEQLESNSYMTDNTYDEDGFSNDDEVEVVNLSDAIEIVKLGGTE